VEVVPLAFGDICPWVGQLVTQNLYQCPTKVTYIWKWFMSCRQQTILTYIVTYRNRNIVGTL